MGTHWRDLKVWQKTHELVLEIYRVTQRGLLAATKH